MKSTKFNQAANILSDGKYRLYSVHYEKKLTPELHLELYVGAGIWQGYLLPDGFPANKYSQCKIIPTKELITVGITNEYQGASWL